MKNTWIAVVFMVLTAFGVAHGDDRRYLEPGVFYAVGTITNVSSRSVYDLAVKAENVRIIFRDETGDPADEAIPEKIDQMIFHATVGFGEKSVYSLDLDEDPKESWLGKKVLFYAVRNGDIYDIVTYRDLEIFPRKFAILTAEEQLELPAIEQAAEIFKIKDDLEKIKEFIKLFESESMPMHLRYSAVRHIVWIMTENPEINFDLVSHLRKWWKNKQFDTEMRLLLDKLLAGNVPENYKYSDEEYAYREERIAFLRELLEDPELHEFTRKNIESDINRYQQINDKGEDLTLFGGPYSGLVGNNIRFDGIPSYKRNPAYTYSWDFGDDSTGIGESPRHIYKTAGTYTVSRTVYGGKGGPVTGTTTVTVTMPPPPVITATLVPPPNENGWNNSDVRVAFSYSDNNVGLAGGTPSKLVATEGANQVIQGSVANSAGLSSTIDVTINLDKTEPIISRLVLPETLSPGASGNVTVEATDNYGIEKVVVLVNQIMAQTLTVTPYTATITAPSNVIPGDTMTITVQAIDLAGNIKTETRTIPVVVK